MIPIRIWSLGLRGHANQAQTHGHCCERKDVNREMCKEFGKTEGFSKVYGAYCNKKRNTAGNLKCDLC